jgi:hypothetical protein
MRYMRFFAFILSTFLFVPSVAAQENDVSKPELDHFEIGRHTFFDFGPPFDFYELLLVRSTGSGSVVQRIILTPPGSACFAPAKIETASTSLKESVSALIGSSSPCAIPEKELRRELKRCKNCMVFSGANITMRVPCGAQSRLIRSDVLDRDMFTAAPNTPEHTSWTMQLLSRLDQALEPGVMEKPAFSVPGEDQTTETKLDPEARRDLESGGYDELFPKAKEKLSSIYSAAQVRLPSPSVQLVSSLPFAPQDPAIPQYPPLARAARVQGPVSFTIVLDADGNPATTTFTQGHPLLLEAVRQAVHTWKFTTDARGQMISGSIQFSLNCPTSSK